MDKIPSFDFEYFLSKNNKKFVCLNFHTNEKIKFSDEQKAILKSINKTWKFDMSKKCYTFFVYGNSEFEIKDYLKNGTIPSRILPNIQSFKLINREQIPFDISRYRIELIEKKGLPLFFIQMDNEDKITININLEHWFFKDKNESEIEIVKKIALSLVGAQLSFPSKNIDRFIEKIDSIQYNLKFEYDKIVSEAI